MNACQAMTLSEVVKPSPILVAGLIRRQPGTARSTRSMRPSSWKSWMRPETRACLLNLANSSGYIAASRTQCSATHFLLNIALRELIHALPKMFEGCPVARLARSSPRPPSIWMVQNPKSNAVCPMRMRPVRGLRYVFESMTTGFSLWA